MQRLDRITKYDDILCYILSSGSYLIDNYIRIERKGIKGLHNSSWFAAEKEDCSAWVSRGRLISLGSEAALLLLLDRLPLRPILHCVFLCYIALSLWSCSCYVHYTFRGYMWRKYRFTWKNPATSGPEEFRTLHHLFSLLNSIKTAARKW